MRFKHRSVRGSSGLRFSEAARPPQQPQSSTPAPLPFRVLRSAHAARDRVWLNARAFMVGDELSAGVHVTATAISALTRHAARHAQALTNGEPTFDNPRGAERRAA